MFARMATRTGVQLPSPPFYPKRSENSKLSQASAITSSNCSPKGRATHSRARRCLILLLCRWRRRRRCVQSFYHSLSHSGRELVDGAIIVHASMDGGAVKVSKPIDDHPVVSKG